MKVICFFFFFDCLEVRIEDLDQTIRSFDIFIQVYNIASWRKMMILFILHMLDYDQCDSKLKTDFFLDTKN